MYRLLEDLQRQVNDLRSAVKERPTRADFQNLRGEVRALRAAVGDRVLTEAAAVEGDERRRAPISDEEALGLVTAILMDRGGCCTSEIARRVRLGPKRVVVLLAAMERDGLVVHTGVRRGSRWSLTSGS